MVLNEVQYPQILLLDPLAGSKCQGSGWVIFLGSVSSQQKFEATDVKALGAPQLSNSVSQLPQFYLENKGKYILKA